MFWLQTTTAVVCTQMATNDPMIAKMTLFLVATGYNGWFKRV